jgi:hypothetical protein
LKALTKKNHITYKGKPIKITADFRIETLNAIRAWSEVFQVLKENNFNPMIVYPAKLSFKIEGGIKVFHNKQKLKQYMTTKPPLHKVLKGNIHIKDEIKHNHLKTGNIKPQEENRQEPGE